jgi:hypothetical protein
MTRPYPGALWQVPARIGTPGSGRLPVPPVASLVKHEVGGGMAPADSGVAVESLGALPRYTLPALLV